MQRRSKRTEAAEAVEATEQVPVEAAAVVEVVETETKTKTTTDELVVIGYTPSPKYRAIPAPHGGAYAWHEGNNWTCGVDVATAAELIAYPHPGFFIANRPSERVVRQLADRLGVEPRNITLPDQPAKPVVTLKDIVGEDRAADLPRFGIANVEQLAAVDEAKFKELVTYSGASKQELRQWINEAKAAL